MPVSAPKHRPMPRLAPVHQVQGQEESYGNGRGGRPWRRKRDAVLKRDGYLCRCDDCKASGALVIAHEVDHIIPLAEGGTDDMSNLAAINRDHHAQKTAQEAVRGARRSRGGNGEKCNRPP